LPFIRNTSAGIGHTFERSIFAGTWGDALVHRER
jgi:hypothetical protein